MERQIGRVRSASTISYWWSFVNAPVPGSANPCLAAGGTLDESIGRRASEVSPVPSP